MLKDAVEYGVHPLIWSVWRIGRDPLTDIQSKWSVDDVVRAMVVAAIEAETNKQPAGATP